MFAWTGNICTPSSVVCFVSSVGANLANIKVLSSSMVALTLPLPPHRLFRSVLLRSSILLCSFIYLCYPALPLHSFPIFLPPCYGCFHPPQEQTRASCRSCNDRGGKTEGWDQGEAAFEEAHKGQDHSGTTGTYRRV